MDQKCRGGVVYTPRSNSHIWKVDNVGFYRSCAQEIFRLWRGPWSTWNILLRYFADLFPQWKGTPTQISAVFGKKIRSNPIGMAVGFVRSTRPIVRSWLVLKVVLIFLIFFISLNWIVFGADLAYCSDHYFGPCLGDLLAVMSCKCVRNAYMNNKQLIYM